MTKDGDSDKVLKHDPLAEADEILSEDFYGSPISTVAAESRRQRRAAAKPKPTHYKVICISMYNEDITELEAKVAEMKKRGYTKANKSQLIRYALSQVDIDDLPPPGNLR